MPRRPSLVDEIPASPPPKEPPIQAAKPPPGALLDIGPRFSKPLLAVALVTPDPELADCRKRLDVLEQIAVGTNEGLKSLSGRHETLKGTVVKLTRVVSRNFQRYGKGGGRGSRSSR